MNTMILSEQKLGGIFDDISNFVSNVSDASMDKIEDLIRLLPSKMDDLRDQVSRLNAIYKQTGSISTKSLLDEATERLRTLAITATKIDEAFDFVGYEEGQRIIKGLAGIDKRDRYLLRLKEKLKPEIIEALKTPVLDENEIKPVEMEAQSFVANAEQEAKEEAIVNELKPIIEAIPEKIRILKSYIARLDVVLNIHAFPSASLLRAKINENLMILVNTQRIVETEFANNDVSDYSDPEDGKERLNAIPLLAAAAVLKALAVAGVSLTVLYAIVFDNDFEREVLEEENKIIAEARRLANEGSISQSEANQIIASAQRNKEIAIQNSGQSLVGDLFGDAGSWLLLAGFGIAGIMIYKAAN